MSSSSATNDAEMLSNSNRDEGVIVKDGGTADHGPKSTTQSPAASTSANPTPPAESPKPKVAKGRKGPTSIGHAKRERLRDLHYEYPSRGSKTIRQAYLERVAKELDVTTEQVSVNLSEFRRQIVRKYKKSMGWM